MKPNLFGNYKKVDEMKNLFGILANKIDSFVFQFQYFLISFSNILLIILNFKGNTTQIFTVNASVNYEYDKGIYDSRFKVNRRR